MSYHIYTTDGIVLKRKPFGESNALFYILTKNLGLIVASAQSVRSHRSKLSPAMQEYSLVSLSCVKGKNDWKITSAIPKKNFYFDRPRFVQKLVSQMTEVLVRMMPGETKQAEIFSVIQSGFGRLENIKEKEISDLEILLMLRILFLFGYIDKNSRTEKFLQIDGEWSEKILQKISPLRLELIKLINKGLRESQL